MCCWWCVYKSIPATYLCASVRKRALTFAHTEGKGEKRRKKEKERRGGERLKNLRGTSSLHSPPPPLSLKTFWPSSLAVFPFSRRPVLHFTSSFFGASYLYISFTPITFPQEFLHFSSLFQHQLVHKGEKAQTHRPRQTVVQGIKEAIRLTCIIFSAIHLVIDVHC